MQESICEYVDIKHAVLKYFQLITAHVFSCDAELYGKRQCAIFCILVFLRCFQ